MKGLLLKDWYLTTKYMRALILISLAFAVMSVLSPENGFFRIYPAVMFAMIPVSLYSYDDREKWTVYAQAFPVSRAQYVTGKYLFGAICTAALVALLAVLHLVTGAEGVDGAVTLSLFLALVSASLMLPVLFRFGAEKGRIAYLIFIGVICGGGAALSLSASSKNVSAATTPTPTLGLCVGAIVLYIASWRLSVALYQKREL